MENILKKSSGRTERFVLAFAIVVVMVFGVLNPLTYVIDFNTAQEISGMGKVVNTDTKALPYGNVCSSELRQKVSMFDNGKEYSWEFNCKKKLCGFMWDEKQRNKAYCCGKEYSMYRKIS